MFNETDNNQNNHYYSEQDYEKQDQEQDSNELDNDNSSHYYSQGDTSEEDVDFHSDYLDSPYDSQEEKRSYLRENFDNDYLEESEEDSEDLEDINDAEDYNDLERSDVQYLNDSTLEEFDDFDDATFSDNADKNTESFENFDEEITDFDDLEQLDEPRRTSFLSDVNDPMEHDRQAQTFENIESQENLQEEIVEDYENNTDVDSINNSACEEEQQFNNDIEEVEMSEEVEEEKTQVVKSKEELKEEVRRKYMVTNDGNINIAKIMVLGVGGGGNNAVNRMIDLGVNTAQFVAINTDMQALYLSHCNPEDRYQIGAEETKGLGAGANPEVGERAAEESRELIENLVDGVDLLFITAGMGGGTGSGAAPVIAKIAKEKGCLTVAVVTKPFFFEGATRIKNAERAIANLKKYVDTIIIIPNDKLIEALRPDTPMEDALKYADDTLRQGICGIADLIATPSLINLDFADVKTILKGSGLTHMGVGRAKGEDRIIEAVKEAVSSPLLETTIEGARGVILNVTGGKDLTITQVREAAGSIREIVDESANVIFGMHIKDNLQEEVIITLIATGFEPNNNDVNDDNTRAYNGGRFNNPRQETPRQNFSAYTVPRSEPDPYTAPDRQWQRVQPVQPAQQAQTERQAPQYNQQQRQTQELHQTQQPYTPRASVVETPMPTHEEYKEEHSSNEKKGLPSFVTRIFGGKKKNQ